MDPYRKPKPGDDLQIPAALMGDVIDTVRAVDQLRDRGGDPLARLAAAGPGTVPISNTLGVAVPQFGILGIDSVFPTPTQNEATFKSRPTLRGVLPSTSSHRGRFAVLQRPLRAIGAHAAPIGPAVISGGTVVQLSVTDEEHEYADVSDGSHLVLASAESGSARILWKEAGTGTKWAYVSLGLGMGELPAFIEYELKEDLGPTIGDSAAVYILDADGERTQATGTIYCGAAAHEGVGSQEGGMDGSEEGTGHTGTAGWFEQFSQYRTLSMSCDKIDRTPDSGA